MREVWCAEKRPDIWDDREGGLSVYILHLLAFLCQHDQISGSNLNNFQQ